MNDRHNDDVSARLNAAKVVAFDAGKLLMKYFGKLSGYQHKGNVDLVTDADRTCEAFIAGQLTSRFPRDSMLGEESGERQGSSAYTWIVDPLDGTTNFVHAHPVFAVSMALEDTVAGQVRAGVVYLPATRELFWARQGQGAHGPAGRLSVSETGHLSDALVATGLPYNRRAPGPLDRILNDWRRMVPAVQGVRRMGAASVDLVYVACGRYDAFFERDLKAWDTAAGAFIVREAGGRTTDFSGRPADPFVPEIVASNGRVHEEFLHILFGSSGECGG